MAVTINSLFTNSLICTAKVDLISPDSPNDNDVVNTELCLIPLGHFDQCEKSFLTESCPPVSRIRAAMRDRFLASFEMAISHAFTISSSP